MTRFMALQSSIGIFTDTYTSLRSVRSQPCDLIQGKLDWANQMLKRLNVDVKVIGEIDPSPSVIFVGNHISYLDIPLIFARVPEISFVAKNEIRHWPLFGAGAKKLDTVFVKRGSDRSRRSAKDSVTSALENGKRIALFPSGTTSIDNKKNWRKGAFEIAADNDYWVQPFRLTYSPLTSVAFIDDDILPTHLYRLFLSGKITATIEFHPPVKVINPLEACSHWQKWAQIS